MMYIHYNRLIFEGSLIKNFLLYLVVGHYVLVLNHAETKETERDYCTCRSTVHRALCSFMDRP